MLGGGGGGGREITSELLAEVGERAGEGQARCNARGQLLSNYLLSKTYSVAPRTTLPPL